MVEAAEEANQDPTTPVPVADEKPKEEEKKETNNPDLEYVFK